MADAEKKTTVATTSTTATPSNAKTSKGSSAGKIFLVILVLVGLIVGAIFLYKKYKKPNTTTTPAAGGVVMPPPRQVVAVPPANTAGTATVNPAMIPPTNPNAMMPVPMRVPAGTTNTSAITMTPSPAAPPMMMMTAGGTQPQPMTMLGISPMAPGGTTTANNPTGNMMMMMPPAQTGNTGGGANTMPVNITRPTGMTPMVMMPMNGGGATMMVPLGATAGAAGSAGAQQMMIAPTNPNAVPTRFRARQAKTAQEKQQLQARYKHVMNATKSLSRKRVATTNTPDINNNKNNNNNNSNIAPYSFVGCFKESDDPQQKAIQGGASAGPLPISECYKLAKQAGARYFALTDPVPSSNTARCVYNSNPDGIDQYDKYGFTASPGITDSDGNQLGGKNVNAVYQILS
jgi:hypothetical protein